MRFKQFMAESTEADEQHLKHLEHAEDHVINAGADGFHHAFHTLNDVHSALQGASTSSTKTAIKYDGSPSVVFGYHPQTKKFFVSSKSAFNKTAKINYNHEDIERNHGHAPGLVEKLKAAFDHLHKVTPKKGVYQGDIMYTHNDVTHHGGKYHFTPNTITYSQKKDSPEGKKISKAKIGVAIHTAYQGPDIETMHAKYGFDTNEKESGFKQHPDVHMLPTHVVHPAKPLQNKFEHHMAQAVEAFNKSTPQTHGAMVGHRETLKTYYNSTIRDGTKATAKGYYSWVKTKHQKEVDKLKSPSGKAKRQEQMDGHLANVNQNMHHIQHVLDIHHHLQKAKDELVHTLSGMNHHGYEHSIMGKPTKPEGFVSIRNNRPTKLVDRQDFSKANFEKNRG